MQLYDFALSGNAYKVRLFTALLGLELELVPIDVGAGENRSEKYLKINPRGQVPVLVDGEITLWDSQAILVYLARRYGDDHWLPSAGAEMAEVMQWMAVAQNELLFGLARARAVKRFGRPWDFKSCQDYGRAGLDVLDAHLGNHQWLAAGRPTIADVACYPYVALAPEAEIPLDNYSNVRAWLSRVQELPGYISMPGIEPVGGET